MRSGRIYDQMTKIGFLLAGWLVLFLGALLIGQAVGFDATILQVVAAVSSVVLIYVLTRFFRMEGESVDPRPWWKVTASQPVGWIVGVYLFFAGIMSMTPLSIAGPNPVGGILTVALGVLFIVSAIKARRHAPTTASAH